VRCKVGDLVVVVRADRPGALGRFGTIVGRGLAKGTDWSVELPNYPAPTKAGWGARDTDLRPIRDQPGQDETLSWKALPSPVEIIKELTK
jgi:hypothetical protein